jgi:hypothetical protein
MAQKKNISTVKKTKKDSARDSSAERTPEADTSEEVEEVIGPKAKKGVDLESALEPAVIIDEKVDEDLPVVAEDEESAVDEVTLDDEELNPFGDKWEQ